MYQHVAWNYSVLGGNEIMGNNTTGFGQKWQWGRGEGRDNSYLANMLSPLPGNVLRWHLAQGGDGRVHSAGLAGPVLPALSCAKTCVLSISTALLGFSHWMSADFSLGFQELEAAGLALISA